MLGDSWFHMTDWEFWWRVVVACPDLRAQGTERCLGALVALLDCTIVQISTLINTVQAHRAVTAVTGKSQWQSLHFRMISVYFNKYLQGPRTLQTLDKKYSENCPFILHVALCGALQHGSPPVCICPNVWSSPAIQKIGVDYSDSLTVGMWKCECREETLGCFCWRIVTVMNCQQMFLHWAVTVWTGLQY